MTVRDEAKQKKKKKKKKKKKPKQNWTGPRIFDVFLNFVKRIRPILNSGCA